MLDKAHNSAPRRRIISGNLTLDKNVFFAYYIIMDKLLLGLSSISTIGLITLWLCFFRWKKSLHYEIVRPDIQLVREHQARQDARLDKVEKKCEDLYNSLDEKFNLIANQQIEITKQIAVVTGKLDIIVENFYKLLK